MYARTLGGPQRGDVAHVPSEVTLEAMQIRDAGWHYGPDLITWQWVWFNTLTGEVLPPGVLPPEGSSVGQSTQTVEEYMETAWEGVEGAPSAATNWRATQSGALPDLLALDLPSRSTSPGLKGLGYAVAGLALAAVVFAPAAKGR